MFDEVRSRDTAAMRATPNLVELGRETCGQLEAALRREWLVTNGLGGYAHGTLAGIPTRAYHGYLVAALRPPVDRVVLVAGLEELLTVDGQTSPLHAFERDDGAITPTGYGNIERFGLDGMLPVWTYGVGGVRLERRVWMAHGRNTTYVRYRHAWGSDPVELSVMPLITRHDHHDPRTGIAAPRVRLLDHAEGQPGVIVETPGWPLRAWSTGGTVSAVAGGRAARRRLRLRKEAARGLADRVDAFAQCVFSIRLEPGEAWALVLTAESTPDPEPEDSLAATLARQEWLLRTAAAEHADPVVRQLVLAADQFIVERQIAGGEEAGRTVIAGYPWFNDWGRDTMIALPGLALATGRHADAAVILRSFGRFVRDGLLPNNFPDHADEIPGHHTIDASLWYPLALDAYARATGDHALVRDLLPVMSGIIDAHVSGTRHRIGLDPRDGLLRGGEPGVQLTWMDAKVEDWVVTPRIGKPVEIQALWVNALRIVAGWLETLAPDVAAQPVALGDGRGNGATDRPRAAAYRAIAERAEASFADRFWRPELGWLADVVDGPDGDDLALRPNQLLALSLPHPLVTGERARLVLKAVTGQLLTSFGLRSLAPPDPAYRDRFEGDRWFRDGAYHQGTVWSWLIGPYVDAYLRVTGDVEGALAALAPFANHLRDGALGSIAEIFEPEPPFDPRGCVAQAWGVAEVLRTWRGLTGQ
jgi:predicted glycogen debranching enzyme